MKEAFYFILDLAEYSIKGYLLYLMVKPVGRVQKDPAFLEKRKKYLLIFQFVSLQMMFFHFPGIKEFFYGGNSYLTNSKQTIAFLVISFSCSLIFACFYGSRQKGLAIYMVCAYYAMSELIRFLVFAPGNLVFRYVLKQIDRHIQVESLTSIQQGIAAMQVLEIVWNVCFVCSYILVLLYLYRKFVRCFWFVEEKISKWEIAFLMAASAMGFSFCIFLRNILFSYTEKEYVYLLEEIPELGFFISFISFLGLIMIFSSVNLLGRLKKEQEEKQALLLYEERLSEMEEHVQEMERLYEGMRGIKHDMKNYIADIEGILGKEEKLPQKTKEALESYMQGICVSLEEMDVKYKTGNPVTDTVINRHLQKAERMGADIQCDFLYPSELLIDSFDLSILLNNGLENAVEALEQCREEKYLEIGSYVKGNMFFLEIRNSFFGRVICDEKGEGLKTTKKESTYHGYGLKNMYKSVEKYYGKMEYKIEGQFFLLTAMLQGKKK